MERQARKATPSRIPAIFARATLPWLLVALFAPSFGAAPAHAQKAMALKGVDTPEPGSVEAIKRFTTDPRFLNPWVAYVPESSTVPSPTDFLGHVADAAGELSNTTRIYGYFRALAEASPRVRVSVIGMSEEGRDILLVTIADEAGLRDLDRLKEATNALADPRVTSPEEADRVIATARPIYYLNAGLHSSETGSPEMVMEMAYRIAVSEEPMIQRIRERLIVLINPVSEPDGRDRQVDWFYRHLKGKTDFRNLPPRSPPYWGKYVYHDNNRDTHQKALQLTQAVHETFYEYRPTVVHDLHESLPLLHTWNGTGPYNVNLDPILITEWFETSLAEVAALTAFGMPGGETWTFGEAWGHHYLESVAVNHNSLGKGYETFGNSTAETVERIVSASGRDPGGASSSSQQWYRPLPFKGRFEWSLRNNTNYMQTGCLASLDYTARNADYMLRNFYRKGYNSWRKGIDEKPHAFVIAPDQGDRRRVAQLVELLRSHRIEVSRARSGFTLAEDTIVAGSYVVRLDQPYRNYAVDLLTPQKFPLADSPQNPYDDTSWALNVHYGVETKAIADTMVRQAPLELITGDVAVRGSVSGSGPVYLLRESGQEALLAARARLSSLRVEIAESSFTAGGAAYPRGSWIVHAPGEEEREALQGVAEELALDFTGAAEAPEVTRHEAPLPRVAIWHPWTDTQSSGWIRLTLDEQGVPYLYIRNEEIRDGALREKYDVILWMSRTGVAGLAHGSNTRFGPLPYTKTEDFPSHGTPDSSEDVTAGIGWEGIANLQRFLGEGGMLVTLGSGANLPIEAGFARGVSRGGGGASTPGVELRVTFTDSIHPAGYGYPLRTSAFKPGSSGFDVARWAREWVVLQWGTKKRRQDRDEAALPRIGEDPDTTGAGKEKEAGKEEGGAKKDSVRAQDDTLLISGGIRNGDALEGRPAIVDMPGPGGEGRVVMFAFDPIHRTLSRSDYRFLWNVLLNWKHLVER